MKKLLLVIMTALLLSGCCTTRKVIVYKFYAPDPKCTPIYKPDIKHKYQGMTLKDELNMVYYNLSEVRKMIDTLVLRIICHQEHLKNIRSKNKDTPSK